MVIRLAKGFLQKLFEKQTKETPVKKSRAKLMPRAIAAGQRFARRAEKLPYFKSATEAYMRGWMAGYRAHRNDVSPADKPSDPADWTKFGPTQYVD